MVNHHSHKHAKVIYPKFWRTTNKGGVGERWGGGGGVTPPIFYLLGCERRLELGLVCE